MRSQPYKLSAPSAQEASAELGARQIASLLERLEARLDHLESRLGSIESRLEGKIPAPAAPKPPVGEPAFSAEGQRLSSPFSQASVSVSGSPTPAAILSSSRELLLAPQDEQIIHFIRSRNHACAEDVRVHFRYKGSNAASARLNRLFELGVLDKQQAGRRVYYRLK